MSQISVKDLPSQAFSISQPQLWVEALHTLGASESSDWDLHLEGFNNRGGKKQACQGKEVWNQGRGAWWQ